MSDKIEKTIKSIICLRPSHLIEELKKMAASIRWTLLLSALIFLGGSCLWSSPANALTATANFQEIVVDDNLKDGYWIEAVDVNNDSQPDLVTSGFTIGEVSWYENPGDLTPQSEWKKHPMITPKIVATVPPKINEDSKTDGETTYALSHVLDDSYYYLLDAFIEVVDFDGDGQPELLLAEHGPKPIFQGIFYYKLIKQEGDIRPTLTIERTKLSSLSTARIAIEDFDGDGKLDFATAGNYAQDRFSLDKPQVLVFLNRIGSSTK
ncbi:VCBS repeat-containing protein [Okeania sp. KiyG1]|uniref:FG-GAP repeat domain-containing protein n=1 Tax=Okeania sp. KiyG1 TaxID=2720165 RepID=UPI0019B14D05|nr:VCBS repeat-containing protein [Okeania sp. KiyG1]GGA27386.1 hypothetical protein CYANOKiyG1_43570 [Okeania sp. KiyG1]